MIIKKISWSNAQYCADNLTHYKIPHKITVSDSGRCVLEVDNIPPEQLKKLPAYIQDLLGGEENAKI